MPHYKSDDLQIWTNGKWLNLPQQKPDIKGFSTDSRTMGEKFAFVAVTAERDGHEFVADAVKNGATAVLASSEVDAGVPVLLVKDTLKSLQNVAKFHRLRFENPVVGITGSCGKTSTKEFLAKLISWKNPLVTEENLNNEIGVPLTLTRIDLRQNQAAIIEAGVAAPGQMEELAKMIEPDLAIITNVAPCHMEKFEELAKIAKEKAVLAQNVAVGGWALFHHELMGWKSFEELKCKKAVVVPAETGDVSADLVFRYAIIEKEGGERGLDISIDGGEEYYFDMPLLSDGLTKNAVLSVAAALILGAREEQIAAKLDTFKPLKMRGGIVECAGSSYYIDCYNASPASMKDALAFFEKKSAGMPRLFALGEMAELGLSAHRQHKEIGSIIRHADGDKAVLFGTHADVYKAGMLESGWSEGDITVADSVEKVSEEISKFKGWIFVKGSRVCQLEKALPEAVREKLALPQEEKEEAKEEEIIQTSPIFDDPDAKPEILNIDGDDEDEAASEPREDGEDEGFDDEEEFDEIIKLDDDERESF